MEFSKPKPDPDLTLFSDVHLYGLVLPFVYGNANDLFVLPYVGITYFNL
jgi:hypothetical protein